MYFPIIILNLPLDFLLPSELYHHSMSLDHPFFNGVDWSYEVIEMIYTTDGGIIFNPNKKGIRFYPEMLYPVSYYLLFIVRRSYVFLNNFQPLLVVIYPNTCFLSFISACIVSWTVSPLFIFLIAFLSWRACQTCSWISSFSKSSFLPPIFVF